MLKYLPKFSIRNLAITILLSLVCLGNSGMAAFEAHIIGVTAEIVNNVPTASPAGGQFCEIDGPDVNVELSTLSGEIVLSINGSDPDCNDPNVSYYNGPLGLSVSSTIKARLCFENYQGPVVEWYFEIIDCGGGAVCGNGVQEGDETCDDGNQSDGDGCSASCQIEEPTGPEMCMKINEVYYKPGVKTNNAGKLEENPEDEWIELYNACDHSVNIQNWYLEDNQGTSQRETITQNYTIESHQFVVIAANASMWQQFWTEVPDNAFKIALGGTKMFNGLADGGDRVVLYDSDNNQIDEVSWGSDDFAFDPSVETVGVGHSISRKVKGVDTNTAEDWFDTHTTSSPSPGPNPGTNPHNADGSLVLPNLAESALEPEIIEPAESIVEEDKSIQDEQESQNQEENNDENMEEEQNTQESDENLIIEQNQNNNSNNNSDEEKENEEENEEDDDNLEQNGNLSEQNTNEE